MSRLEATPWLEHLDRAREVALAGVDPEGVHQVRVAARRLRVWLTLGGHEALQDDLRWLCDALSAERDLDVLREVLSGTALEPFQQAARAHVREALESPRYAALREALGAVKGPKRKRASRATEKLERAVKRRRRELPSPVTLDSLEALHALRRALRRARYAREWLGLGAKAFAAEQEQLGALCDLCALRRFAARHVEAMVAPVEEGIGRALVVLNEAASAR